MGGLSCGVNGALSCGVNGAWALLVDRRLAGAVTVKSCHGRDNESLQEAQMSQRGKLTSGSHKSRGLAPCPLPPAPPVPETTLGLQGREDPTSLFIVLGTLMPLRESYQGC